MFILYSMRYRKWKYNNNPRNKIKTLNKCCNGIE